MHDPPARRRIQPVRRKGRHTNSFVLYHLQRTDARRFRAMRITMHSPIKYFEKGLSFAANGAWVVFDRLNKINQNPSFTPRWSDKPILKSYQKTKPPLGWPRETDSLCPTCTREARQAILDGKKDVSVLLNEKVGEIKATILERDGKILMVKDCPLHGHFEIGRASC